MADIQQNIQAVTERLVQCEQEIIDLEKSALAHEAEARAARLARDERKKEAASLRLTVGHQRTIKATEDAAAAAKAAQASAEKAKADQEAALARLAAKEKQLDALLAKAEAKADEPAAPTA